MWHWQASVELQARVWPFGVLEAITSNFKAGSIPRQQNKKLEKGIKCVE